MKYSPISFLAILSMIFLFISPVSAISITGFKDLHGVGQVIPVASYTGTRDNIFYVADDRNITMYDTLGSSYSTGQIQNFPADVSSVWGDAEYIYVILYTGAAYRIDNSIGLRDFTTIDLVGDDRTGVYLGDFSDMDRFAHRIVADDAGNIYIYDYSSTDIIKIDGSNLASVTYYSSPETTEIAGIFPGSDGLYNYNNDLNVYRITDVETATTVFTCNLGIYPTGISQLSNGNILTYGGSSSTTLNEYTEDGVLVGSVFNSSTSYVISSADPGNIFVCANGIITLTTEGTPSNTVSTFTTVSGAGGYYSSESGLSLPQLEYNSRDIATEYPTYYNMSSITVNWNIAIDEDNWNELLAVSDPFDVYQWQFELWSPDGVSVSSYKISESSFKRESYYLGIIGTGDMVSIGGAKYPNINMNGTWTVKLYERNVLQGTKSLLDSYSFEIQDINNPFGISDVTPTDTDTTNLVSNFIESPYMVAIIIIGIVGFSFGRDRTGRVNGTAMVVLIPLAVGICCIMGILPMWIMYTMVLCIIAFIAIKMSGGGS